MVYFFFISLTFTLVSVIGMSADEGAIQARGSSCHPCIERLDVVSDGPIYPEKFGPTFLGSPELEAIERTYKSMSSEIPNLAAVLDDQPV